jgi:hypothetical protein
MLVHYFIKILSFNKVSLNFYTNFCVYSKIIVVIIHAFTFFMGSGKKAKIKFTKLKKFSEFIIKVHC